MRPTAGRVLAACALASLLGGAAPVAASPGSGGSSPAAVLPINVPPVPLPDAWTVIHDTKLRVDAPGVLANDTDADGDELEAKLVTGTAHGELNLHHDGSFVYEPDDGFVGLDGFTYAADDGTIGVPAAVVLTVTNTKPIANDDSYSTKEGTRLTVGRPGVLKNDADADGDTLVTKLVDTTNHGVLTLEDRGKFDYVPDNGFVGTDSFTYRASDGADLSDPAKVTIDVVPGPKPTPTPPPSPTAPPSPTPTPAPTPTPPPTPSPTDPPTPSPTPVRTDNPTPTPTPTPTTPPDRTPDPTLRPEPTASPTLVPPVGHDPGSPGSQGGSAPGPGGGPDGGSRGSDGEPGQGSITQAGTPTGRDLGLGRPATSDMSNASIAFDAGVDMAFDGFSWQVPALVLSVPGLLVVVAVFLQVVGGLAWLPVIRRRLGTDGLTPPDRRP